MSIPKSLSSGPTSLLPAYMDVTAVITSKIMIRGFETSNISFNTNSCQRYNMRFNLFESIPELQND